MLQRAETAATLAGVAASRAFFDRCRSGRDELLVAHVDERARCIHLARYAGNETIPSTAILTDAAQFGSAGLVLASIGEQTDGPGHPAVRETHDLVRAAGALDVTVLDHLALSRDGCTSLRRMGRI